MKKIIFLMMAVSLLTAGCSKKGEKVYTFFCK